MMKVMMKNTINNYLKNILGWRTKRKIVVFSVDDYGNVRLDSKKARENLDKAGLKVLSRFDAYDTLETKDDLTALFDVLSSVRDINGNKAVFTAFSVPVNIDFEEMERNRYSEYKYELLPKTYEKLSNKDSKAYNGAWELWKEGMEKKILHAEFHGREHFNLKVFNEKLKNKDKEIIESLKNRSLISISDTGYLTVSFSGAFKFWNFEENNNFEDIIISGLNEFEKVFGYRAKHFNAPGGTEHPAIHQYLKIGGIKYLDTPFIKSEHHGKAKFKRVLNYTGKMNKYGQIFQVRNCVFEPTEERGFNWVNYTFKQVEAAFNLRRPAIISTHRVNFSGYIDESNRKKGLKSLKELLYIIIRKYGNVEFMTSNELGREIEKDKV